MSWIREVPVEKAREEDGLDFWREERGDDVETYLPSGHYAIIEELLDYVIWCMQYHTDKGGESRERLQTTSDRNV